MASLLRYGLILLFVILIIQDTDGWRRRRRRRRRCNPVNCRVGSWSGWSPCTHRCGNAGTQFRTRRKIFAERCGGVCPHQLREVRGCNRNACQNGGSPAVGYCRCPAGYRGTCCEIAMSTTVAPTTLPTTGTPVITNYTVEPTNASSPITYFPCLCYNGGSPVCRNGRLRYCVCFRGHHGRQCEYGPTTTRSVTGPTTTTARPVTTGLPCLCYNGGSPVCRNGRLQYCVCLRGHHGRQCEYGPTTARPVTTLPCFCYNRGIPVCRGGILRYCICKRGYYGKQCQYGATTRRPFTRFTPGRHLRCYQCASFSKEKCTSKIQNCRYRSSVCFSAQVTYIHNGQTMYVAGCTDTPIICRTGCDRIRRSGKVSKCSLRCCRSNLCNDIRNQRPKNNWLRLLLKLLEAFKRVIDAIAAILKAHVSSDVARLHKREIVSMMAKVDDTVQRLEDSSEPEVLQAKRDVAETRMRALEMIKKLDDHIGKRDDYIDPDSDLENQK